MDELEQMARAMWESDVGKNGIDPAGKKTRPTWAELPRDTGPVVYWTRKAEIARQALRVARKSEPTTAMSDDAFQRLASSLGATKQ